MKTPNRTPSPMSLVLVALVATSTLSTARADEPKVEIELYGMGGLTYYVSKDSVQSAQITTAFDPDLDLPKFGNFRRVGETNPAGNGFGMAYRTQQHLHLRQGAYFGRGSSYLSISQRLGEQPEAAQMLAFEEDTLLVHTESQASASDPEAGYLDIARGVEAASNRNQVLTITSNDGQHRRYLFVIEARQVGQLRIFRFFDPHDQWTIHVSDDATETRGAPDNRFGTLVSANGRFYVSHAWDYDAAGGNHHFCGAETATKFEARWTEEQAERSSEDFYEVNVSRFGTASAGESTFWSGYNWKRATSAGSRTLSGLGLDGTPIRYIEAAINGTRAAIAVQHRTFDAIDPELTEM